MVPQIPHALLTYGLAGLLIVGFAVFVALLIMQRRHARKRAEFPTVADLTGTCAAGHAAQLLDLLLAEIAEGRASVYRPIGGDFWNVWLPSSVVPGGQRLTLHDWACERGIPQLQHELVAGGAQ